MMKAYPASEYRNPALGKPGSAGRAIWDSINLCEKQKPYNTSNGYWLLI